MKNLFARKNLMNEVRKQCDENMPIGFEKVIDFPNVDCLFLEHGYIADVLTPQLVHQLLIGEVIGTQKPMLISAQTGTGKTTFIFKTLLPIARRNHKKILYLVSRKAQKMHIKKDAMRDPDNGKKWGGTSFSCRTQEYAFDMLDNIIEFGDLVIMSYQEFVFRANQLNMENVMLTVLDEAHYFLSDAGFNVYTEKCLETILKKCQKTVRIYMTATADEVATILYDRELEFAAQRYYDSRFRFHVVYMGEDYTYLEPCFFHESSTMAQLINESPTTIQWLIFVRSKKEGQALYRQLHKLLGKEEEISFITAESNHGENPNVLSILENETLLTRITLSTKVLDLGVNLKMENLRIVLFEDDMMEIKQMIGRYRLSSAKVRLPIYMYIPSQDVLNKRLDQANYCLNKFNQDNQHLKEPSYISQLPFPFYLNPYKKLEYNHFSEEKWIADVWNRNDLMDSINNYKIRYPDMDFSEIFAKIMLKNFPKSPKFNELMILDGKVPDEFKQELFQYIQTWRQKGELNGAQWEKFNEGLKEFLPDTRKDVRACRNNLPGLKSRNSQLKKYGIEIRGYTSANNERHYVIEPLQEEER